MKLQEINIDDYMVKSANKNEIENIVKSMNKLI